MNRILKLALPVALAALSGHAAAQFYVGGALGRVNHDMDRADWTNARSSTTYDETDNGFKLYGGYKFSPTWAIEGGYASLGDYKATATSRAPVDTGNASVKVRTWTLFAVGTLPIASGFSVMGKAGIAMNNSKMSFSSRGLAYNATDSGSANKTSFAWGVGASYAITPKLSARVEYENFGKAGDSNNGFTTAGKTSDSKPTMWSIGLNYAF